MGSKVVAFDEANNACLPFPALFHCEITIIVAADLHVPAVLNWSFAAKLFCFVC